MATGVAGSGKQVLQEDSYDARYGKLLDLAESLRRQRDRIVREAVRELRFTIKDSEAEVDISIDRLGMFAEAAILLRERTPLGGEGSFVSLMLSYNGSAWLNTAITSIYLVGNRVNVRFSSKGSDVMRLTEEMYRPIFGDEVTFYAGGDRSSSGVAEGPRGVVRRGLRV